MKTTKDHTDERILNQIYIIDGKRIIFDFDLAILYGVETKYLKRTVRRNLERFPDDFMFELGVQEFENQRSQIGTFNLLKYRPFCFTEQGVTMLACVLNSNTAIQMNVRIIRLFSKMREELSTQKEIHARLELIERHVGDHDKDLSKLFEAIHHLLSRDEIRLRTNEIGFTKYRRE